MPMGSKKQQTKEFARNILLYLIYHFQEEWKGIAADAEVQEFNKHTHNFLAAFQKLTGIQIDRTNPDWFCMKEPPTLRDYRISAAKGVVGYTPYLNAVSVLETCLSKLDQGKITLYQLTAENSNSGPEADSGFQFIGDGDNVSQVFYNGKPLTIAPGRLTAILKKLHDSMPNCVPYSELGSTSIKADEQLRNDKAQLDRILKKYKTGHKIITHRGFGYSLNPHKIISHRDL